MNWKHVSLVAAIILATLAAGAGASGAVAASSTAAASEQNAFGDVRPANQGRAWFFECVDCPKQFDDMTDRSLRVDADGYPHVAFGENFLYHAWKDDDGWHSEVVDDSSGVGRYAALYLDTAGYVHISYYDENNGALRYAHKDATGWHIDQVDDEGDVGQYTSVVVDAAGYPRISYYDADQKNLRYAYQDASGWHKLTLDSDDDVGKYTSLALDAEGYTHIAYYDEADDDLEYAYQDQDGWHTTTIDSDGVVGRYVSLAIDSLGTSHFSYHDWTHKSLKYAYFGGPGDVGGPMDPIEDVDDVGRYTSIAVDGDNKPHIVFATYQCTMWVGTTCSRYEARDLLYTRQNASAEWESPLRVGYCGEHASLAFGADGVGHVSYVNDSNGYLKYARRVSSLWSRVSIEEGGNAGLNLSLDLNNDGDARISYYDGISDNLQYALRSAEGWSAETVQTSGPISTIAWGSGDTSLELDTDDQAHISFYMDGGIRAVMYAYQEPDGWHLSTADGLGNPGYYNSLALDGSGLPHISYYNSSDYPNNYYDLKYVYRQDDDWHPGNVDTVGKVGRYNALALDSSDRPHISYYDESNADLKYATKVGGDWEFITVDAAGDVGKYTSMALTADGLPRISYYDETRGNLAFAKLVGSVWMTETVDSADDVGLYTSLALDQDGYAHISYHDKTNLDLKYAHEDASGWHVDIVDSWGDVGLYSSLALDDDGFAHIGYYDSGNKGLRYAYQAQATFGLTLVPSTARRPCLPGAQAVFALEVTNQGNAQDTFDVIETGNNWPVTTSSQVGPLAPGFSALFHVTVDVPGDATIGDEDTAVVTVTSRGDPAKSSSASLTTWVAHTVSLPMIVK